MEGYGGLCVSIQPNIPFYWLLKMQLFDQASISEELGLKSLSVAQAALDPPFITQIYSHGRACN